MGFSVGHALGSINNGIGGALNSLTGITSSANQAYAQNVALANLSNAYSKEFAQNAHQWEMNDLQKAGLNPALTTGATSAGSIASAGGNGNSGSVGTSAMSPIDIVSALNQTSATKHSNSLQDNQGKFAYAQAVATIEMLPINKKEKQALIRKLDAETKYTNERARGFTESYTSEESESSGKNGGWNIAHIGGKNKGHTNSKSRKVSRTVTR